MPQTLAFFLFTIGAPLAVVNFVVAGVGAALVNLAISTGLSYLANRLLQPATPKAADGKYNLRQNVPSRVRVYGRVKKGGDYVFLEEVNGIAYHIIVWAAHRIEAFDEHWLHDELVTLDGGGVVTAPAHFQQKVTIITRRGSYPELAYAQITDAFPSIWTANHRGDGLASVMLAVESVSQEDFQTTFPQGMPSHTAVGRGALLWDPRTSSTVYSENLALIRLDHIMAEFGLRRALAEIDLASFIAAADICDATVLNRDGDPEPAYAASGWIRYENRPAEVGKIIDQAGDFMLFETAAGKIGIHAGVFVEPDVTLDEDAIISLSLDLNARQSTTCIAARGRYTSIEHGYNQVDAAVYGDPYATDDDRTLTLDNSWVQRHNHIQRLQKLAFIRANARRVSVVAHYEAAQDVPSRRFIRINVPPRLDNVVVELIGRPKVSLANLTISFDGVIVPETLYAFNAATEEGIPPPVPDEVVEGAVPVPAGLVGDLVFDVIGGVLVSSVRARWTAQDPALEHDVELETVGAGTVVYPVAAALSEMVIGPLSDTASYKVRVRSVSGGGAHSDWSAQVTVAEPTLLLADADSILAVDADSLMRAD